MQLSFLKQQVQDLLIFDKQALRSFEPNEFNLNKNISYWLEIGELIQLKKGLYCLRDTWLAEPDKDLFLEYIANQLLLPSYVSVEYVMAKHQLLSEPVQVVTSMTTQTTREMSNDLASFKFFSLKSELFIGYETRDFRSATVRQASKAKAVFDYLYLRFLKTMDPEPEAIKALRINWENLTQAEYTEMVSFLSLANSQRLDQTLAVIKDLYY